MLLIMSFDNKNSMQKNTKPNCINNELFSGKSTSNSMVLILAFSS